jgi:hypothetical protein
MEEGKISRLNPQFDATKGVINAYKMRVLQMLLMGGVRIPTLLVNQPFY